MMMDGDHHGQKKNGFVLEARLGAAVTLAGISQGAMNPLTLTLPAVVVLGDLTLGYKIDRIVVSLSTEFSNVAAAVSPNTGTSSSATDSKFLLIPGVQVAILRSKDQRVEMVGSARFGFGRVITTSDPSVNDPNTYFSFMYELAPGVRFWAHRHLALNFMTGFRGDYDFVFENTAKTTIGTNGIFFSFGAMGVF